MSIQNENRSFIFDTPQNINFVKKIKHNLKAYYYGKKLDKSIINDKRTLKYDVSICSIFKNEAPYLKEWIEFHLIVGINHFYMYNNNSSDDFNLILKPYIERGIVTLIDWPKNQAQMECYKDCINNYKNETKWLGFIDIDEFVTPIKYDNVYEFLKPFEKNRGSVLIYWKMFTTSGKIDRDINGLVIEDFTISWPKLMNIGKCFYNTKYDFLDNDKNSTLHHLLWTKFKKNELPPVDSCNNVVLANRNKEEDNFGIQINHYFTKSYNEYLLKKSKGDVYFKINPHDEAYFYHHEIKSTSVDYNIYKYLIKLKLRVGKENE